jgi:5,10-methylenetetrahydromethanopterin reductase
LQEREYSSSIAEGSTDRGWGEIHARGANRDGFRFDISGRMMSGLGVSISVALPPSRAIVDQVRLAARLGYRRVFVFDSPALYGDVWIAMARIAESVPDIGLATGVAVPSLRHPMVTASAIATVEELAPGRVSAYFGTGFTARLAMGKRGLRWSDLATYVTQVRTLLHGDVAEVDGARCQMIHSPGFAPARPIDVPLGLAPVGPKGFAVARELAKAVILTMPPGRDQRCWEDIALLAHGTVLEPGEDHETPRVVDATGPWYTTGAHGLYEWGRDALRHVPGGLDWVDRVETERSPEERHLAVHKGHLVEVTGRDRALVLAAGERILGGPLTGTPIEVAARLRDMAGAGVTEVAYNPTGPDIDRELETFAAASRGL